MSEYTDAIRKLRDEIKTLADKGRENRAEIAKLKLEPGTGPKRNRLRTDYICYVRGKARHALLAYALLRGRPYATLERKCVEAAEPGWILGYIQEAFKDAPETPEDFTVLRVKNWLKGNVEVRHDDAHQESAPAAQAAG